MDMQVGVGVGGGVGLGGRGDASVSLPLSPCLSLAPHCTPDPAARLAAPPQHHPQVWDFAGPGHVRWSAADAGAPRMGVVVENRRLQAALLRAATGADGPGRPVSGFGEAGGRAAAWARAAGGCGAGLSPGSERGRPQSLLPTHTTPANPGPTQAEIIAPASVEALSLPGTAPEPAAAAAAAPSSGGDGDGGRAASGGGAGSSGRGSGGGGGGGSNALAELALAGGRRLRARLVVGADGGGSHVRALAGLRTAGWGYQQRGLVATGGRGLQETRRWSSGFGGRRAGGGAGPAAPWRALHASTRRAQRAAPTPAAPAPAPTPPPSAPTTQVETDAPNATAWQRFLPDGPLALLPVRGGFSNIVWTNTPEGAARLEAMGPEEFAGGGGGQGLGWVGVGAAQATRRQPHGIQAAPPNDPRAPRPPCPCGPPDAANAALQGAGAPPPGGPLPSLLSGIAAAGAGALGALGGAAARLAGAPPPPGGGGGGGGGGELRPPPRVVRWVGGRPKSFPLQMRHSGRCGAAARARARSQCEGFGGRGAVGWPPLTVARASPLLPALPAHDSPWRARPRGGPCLSPLIPKGTCCRGWRSSATPRTACTRSRGRA
jgi:hypothetical protein